jgi:hypothetical protein
VSGFDVNAKVAKKAKAEGIATLGSSWEVASRSAGCSISCEVDQPGEDESAAFLTLL